MRKGNSVELKNDGADVIVTANNKEVFRKPKTDQTVAIANEIYFAYKYENKVYKGVLATGEE